MQTTSYTSAVNVVAVFYNFYLGFLVWGGSCWPNRVGGSRGILPRKILNFTLPEMQSSVI